MEVILLERIEKLGQMGDVVKVKPGYARNYLLPQRKALRATKNNLTVFEAQRAQLEAQNLERKQEAESVAEKLDNLQVVMIRQAGDTGQLYGSVTARDLAEAVTEAGFTIERSQVVMDKATKMLGLHPIKVRLHPEVAVTVVANVARSEAEAESQAKAGRVVTVQEQLEAEEAALEATLAEIEAEEEGSGEPEAAAEEAATGDEAEETS
ncbi:MAG: 50S ribosomal protein L9 [Kiloniellales bacterium]|nr:50S ribosomal protein L9 [Kiloniellales bacterium]